MTEITRKSILAEAEKCVCTASGMEITDEYYCSYGERRDEK